ncbi:hypothetical protein PCASD_11931 [Puccinia coronata f. sp. avenae]|uniref:Uncharacterized protein n=1 Tax=Puccinia coronata f. sp. avenae TaxID=200324 RepID=A0A2N5UWG1_9BASI|nr:hypothetical protein PCASD_11931 [Puccinia coronata f. sp. avenae]
MFISRDYTPTKLSFPYNSTSSLIKPPDTLPQAVSKSSSDKVTFTFSTPAHSALPISRQGTRTGGTPPPSPPSQRHSPSPTPTPEPPAPPSPRKSGHSSQLATCGSHVEKSMSQPAPPKNSGKNFEYVPVDRPPAKEIIGGIDPRNVITGSRRSGPTTSNPPITQPAKHSVMHPK